MVSSSNADGAVDGFTGTESPGVHERPDRRVESASRTLGQKDRRLEHEVRVIREGDRSTSGAAVLICDTSEVSTYVDIRALMSSRTSWIRAPEFTVRERVGHPSRRVPCKSYPSFRRRVSYVYAEGVGTSRRHHRRLRRPIATDQAGDSSRSARLIIRRSRRRGRYPAQRRDPRSSADMPAASAAVRRCSTRYPRALRVH